jgi:hypothetical protein
MAKPADLSTPGPWSALFEAALTLTDHLASVIEQPVWSFGGGTVLMLRLRHRFSRDIDLFVPGPALPRACDAAAERRGRNPH